MSRAQRVLRPLGMAGLGVGVLVTTSLVAISPAAAAAGSGFELLVVGNPNSPVPEPFASESFFARIGDAWDGGATSISDIGGLTADGNSVSITATCTSGADPDNLVAKPLVQVELGGQLAYQYQVGGAAGNLCAASEVASFQLTIATNAASCLVSGRPDQLEAGTYPLTRDQVTSGFGTDFTVDPLAPSYPAFIATKGGSAGTFTSADVLGGATDKWGLSAYLPASRPCAPTAGPIFSGTAPFATNGGRLGVFTGLITSPVGSAIQQIQAQAFTTTIALASGGGGRYQDQQIMAAAPGTGITGAKRIQALPMNAGSSGTSPWGGVRTDGLFVQCGANTGTTLVTTPNRCRLGGITNGTPTIGGTGQSAPGVGVRVDPGGGATWATDGFQHWSAAGTAEVGQTVKFRSREVSWAGYGLHSPETTITMANGN